MAEICAVCVDAGIFCEGRLFRAACLPTGAALKVLVEKMGVPDAKARDKIQDMQLAANYMIDRCTVNLGKQKPENILYDVSRATYRELRVVGKKIERLSTLEFDRVRKSMSVIVREPNGQNRLLVKATIIFETPGDEFQGVGCLGLAYKDDLGEFSDYYSESHPAHKKLLDPTCYMSIETDLVFVGVVGLRVRICCSGSVSHPLLSDSLWFCLASIIVRFALVLFGIHYSQDQTPHGFNPAGVDIMRKPKPPRKSNNTLVNSWVLFRYLVIGSYVGIAAVGIFILWYTQASFLGINLVSDGHTLVQLSQLRNWVECPTWSNFTLSKSGCWGTHDHHSSPCDYLFTDKVKAMTLSLSVLAAIEMFNSLKALSDENSLELLVAVRVSFGLHCAILYVPFLADVLGIIPLSLNQWFLVIVVSAPVILIDEALKFAGRRGRGRYRAKKEKIA
ncbi:hypothetical protein SADUNF_Sadunf02G0146300 [Salix dunnii]|uniref:Cation-transporting P-type ATPase C-terminal domain-containing protein n=1 Tax=Salix dunnii TaxID=1413687 RepID=A0A835N894_9ROSI|nr:hypothetical protein SADUNF_Sadunf02G0146300 [Salix dunnii]